MEKQIAALIVQRAFRQRVPRAADYVLEGVQNVLSRAKMVDNRIGEWIGPFPILKIYRAKKLVFIQDRKFEQLHLSAKAF